MMNHGLLLFVLLVAWSCQPRHPGSDGSVIGIKPSALADSIFSFNKRLRFENLDGLGYDHYLIIADVSLSKSGDLWDIEVYDSPCVPAFGDSVSLATLAVRNDSTPVVLVLRGLEDGAIEKEGNDARWMGERIKDYPACTVFYGERSFTYNSTFMNFSVPLRSPQ